MPFMAARTRDDQTGFLWVEEGETKNALVADVAIASPHLKTYTYSIPEELEGQIQLGHRVNVTVGKSSRKAEGFVIAIAAKG